MKIAARAALIVCLLHVAPLSSAETALDAWPAAAHEGPILVRLKEGRTIEAIGPVKGDDGALVFRLLNRTLVSLKTDTVEWIGTPPARRESDSVKGDVAPPSSQNAETGRATMADALPDPPRVYGNADLPPALESGSAPPDPPPAPVTDGAAPAGKQEIALSYEGYRDRNGRDEQWWRDRVARLAKELETTEKDIERLEGEVRVARARAGAPLPTPMSGGRNLGVVPRTPNRRVSSLDAQKIFTLEEALAALKAARARREELRAETAGLSDEARQVGALPGWLR